MYWDITSAEYVDGYRIAVRFRDGESGTVDLRSLIDKGGVFAELRDIDVFKAFSIESDWHVLSWLAGRIDIAPESLYEEATGKAELQRVAEDRAPYGSP